MRYQLVYTKCFGNTGTNFQKAKIRTFLRITKSPKLFRFRDIET